MFLVVHGLRVGVASLGWTNLVGMVICSTFILVIRMIDDLRKERGAREPSTQNHRINTISTSNIVHMPTHSTTIRQLDNIRLISAEGGAQTGETKSVT